MPRALLPGVLAMAAIVIASNILVQFLVGDWLTWGAFTYPFAFLVTDLMNRLHGPAAARRVVLAGFLVGLACSFVGSQIDGPFGPLVSLRVALASGTAFLVGQLLDVAVFNRLRAGKLVEGALRLQRRRQRPRHGDLLPRRLLARPSPSSPPTSTSPGPTSRCRSSATARSCRCGRASPSPTSR